MGISFPHSPAIVGAVDSNIFVLGTLTNKKLQHFIKCSQELSSLWLLETVGKWVLSPDISLFHRLGNEIPIRLKIARLKKRVEDFWFIFQKEPQSQTRLIWVVFSPSSTSKKMWIAVLSEAPAATRRAETKTSEFALGCGFNSTSCAHPPQCDALKAEQLMGLWRRLDASVGDFVSLKSRTKYPPSSSTAADGSDKPERGSTWEER